mmetsp:Transcript_22923/g.58477  ORF Transcript_22923/g.58477 Transcript_22923/m.58477 type:complete len:316 (-) Transcript_22923:34-981(-)
MDGHLVVLPLVTVVQQADEAAQRVQPALGRQPGQDARRAGLVVVQPPGAAWRRHRARNRRCQEIGALLEHLGVHHLDLAPGLLHHPSGDSLRGEEGVLRPTRRRLLLVADFAPQQLHELLALLAAQVIQQLLPPVGELVHRLFRRDDLSVVLRWAQEEGGVVPRSADDLQEEAHLCIRSHVAIHGVQPEVGRAHERSGDIGDDRHRVPAMRAHVVVQLYEVPLDAILRARQDLVKRLAGRHAHWAIVWVEGQRRLASGTRHLDDVPRRPRLPRDRRQRLLCRGQQCCEHQHRRRHLGSAAAPGGRRHLRESPAPP